MLWTPPDFALGCPACGRWPSSFFVSDYGRLWRCLVCNTEIDHDDMVAANQPFEDSSEPSYCTDGLWHAAPVEPPPAPLPAHPPASAGREEPE